MSFSAAQEIFKGALKAPQIRLELVRGAGGSKTAAIPKKPPAPVYPAKRGAEEEATPREVELVEGEERGD